MPGGEAGEGDPREDAGAGAAEKRNQRGFDEDLAENAPAAGPDGHADGNFAGAVRGACCEETAEIGAGGQEHDAGKGHHAGEKSARRRSAGVADQTRASELEAEPFLIDGILAANAGSDGIELRRAPGAESRRP